MLDENKGGKYMYGKRKIGSFPEKNMLEYDPAVFYNFPSFFLKAESLHMITRQGVDQNTLDIQVYVYFFLF
jgi:hypothetical protein